MNIKHGDKFQFLWFFVELVEKLVLLQHGNSDCCKPSTATWAGASKTLGRPFPVQSAQTVPTAAHCAQRSALLTAHLYHTHYTLTRIFCLVSFLHCLHRFCNLCTFTLNLGRENESAGSEDSLIARVPLCNPSKFFSVARFLFLIENNQSLHTYICDSSASVRLLCDKDIDHHQTNFENVNQGRREACLNEWPRWSWKEVCSLTSWPLLCWLTQTKTSSLASPQSPPETKHSMLSSTLQALAKFETLSSSWSCWCVQLPF